MAEQNQNEAVSLADELARVKSAHENDRERLRELDADARKVPSLSSERDRLQGELDKAKAENKSLRDQLNEAGVRARELESWLRDKHLTEQDFADLEEDLDAVKRERDKAQAESADKDRKIAQLQGESDSKDDHIEYLYKKAKHFDHLVDLGVVKGI